MKTEDLVSVIIPAYNEENQISDCLRSVIGQTWNKPFEIIVVDNNSTDNTALLSSRMGANVVFEPVRGIAQALQKGFSVARGDIIVVIEADTCAPKEWLQSLCESIIHNPESVAATCPYDFKDSRFYNFLPYLWFNYAYRLLTKAKMHIRGNLPLIAGPSFAVRKEAMKAIEAMDSTLLTGIDTYLSGVLSKVGNIDFIPNLWVHTSARRFKKNPLGTFIIYFLNFFGMLMFSRIIINHYPDYR